MNIFYYHKQSKYALLLLSVLFFTYELGFATSYPYKKKWEEIEQKEIAGLLKSVQPQVDEIYAQAKKDKLPQQKVRALLYQSKIAVLTKDEVQQKTALFARFKQEIAQAGTIEQQVLQSLLAGLLQEYYQSNRYQIDRRTDLDSAIQTNDFLTWSQATFKQEIKKLYQNSLHDHDLLQQTPVAQWVFLLDTASQYRELRPTMFDILVHRAIAYDLSSGEQAKAQRLLNELIDLHTKNGNANAELYNRLFRLTLPYIPTDSLDERISQLKTLQNLHPDAWYTAEIIRQQVDDYQRLLNATPKTEGVKRKEYAEIILELCEQAQRYPTTLAAQQLQRTKKQLLQPEINVRSEEVHLPAQAIPLFIEHKNIDRLYVRVCAYPLTVTNYLDKDVYRFYDNNRQEVLDGFFASHQQVLSYSIGLHHFDDYQMHSTLAKLTALPKGNYMVIFSNNENFRIDSTSTTTFLELGVSRYALVDRDNELLLTDRDKGTPLSGRKINIYEHAGGDEQLQLLATVITGANGRATFDWASPIKNKGSHRLVYQIEDDEVLLGANRYVRFRNKPNDADEEPETKIQFFTDRAIYRPGQTVYFKGIIYQEVNGKRNVLSNYQATVDLYDPNDDDVASVKLTSNEYGSIFGSFVLPVGKLTGEYYLEEEDCDQQQKFRVEEYKRPTFELSLDTVKERVRLGDSIRIQGHAQAFSGANISHGKVVYRVERNTFFPYHFGWGNGVYPQWYNSEELVSGESQTDAAGKFVVSFAAKPAEEQVKGHFRFYRYTVHVSVTDVNGETHEGEQTIAIGDKSVILHVSLPAKQNIEQMDSIAFVTTNLNNLPVSAKGNIRLTRLKAPARILRKFPFGSVDYQLMDSVEFVKAFPHLPYGDEQNNAHWPKDAVVLNQDFDSANEKAIRVTRKQDIEAGTYLLESYVLDGKDTLRSTQVVQLERPSGQKPVDNEFLSVSTAQPFYAPGERAEIVFSSAIPNAVVLAVIEQNGKILREQQVKLNNNRKRIALAIPQDIQASSLYVHYYLGRYNDVEQGIIPVTIVPKQTELQVSTRTFRSKLLPGQQETWELHIAGVDKDQVAAEMVAAMYDISLDQFVPHRFDFPKYFENTYAQLPRWDTSPAFDQSYGRSFMLGQLGAYLPSIRYENLQDFGFSLMNTSWKQQRYVNQLSSSHQQTKDANGVMVFNSVNGGGRSDLQEVVVVGYGSQKKLTVTGAVSTVQINGLQDVGHTLAGVVPGIQIRGAAPASDDGQKPLYVVDGQLVADISSIDADDILQIQVLKGSNATALYGARAANGVILVTTKAAANEKALMQVTARSDLKETAFFYPDLRTDAEGNVTIRFTAPERLTQWKLMAFAHTPDLVTGYLERTARTSKELMVVPHAPRFLRAGDELVFSAKIVNLSDRNLNGLAKLLLFDAVTMQPLDTAFALQGSTKNFEVEKGGNKQLSWRLKIPALQQAVVYRVVATAENLSDGEEAALPVLPNRILVTETLPIYAKEGQTKHFTLEALASARTDTQHQRLTLELTTNPLWYAIQALPYLQEYPYACSEQLFAKLYATLVSKKLLDTSPAIKTLFDEWNQKGLLQSKLETNPELKSILLEETPWVREATDEETRMKRLALLFDINNLRNQWQTVYQQFAERQLPSGAFSWFDGGAANQTITTHIIAGFGHLQNMQVAIQDMGGDAYQDVVKRAIAYLDQEVEKELNKENRRVPLSYYTFSHYLYARSFFLTQYPLKEAIRQQLLALLHKPEAKPFTNLQQQAMLVLIYNRFGKQAEARRVLAALKDYAVDSEEKGMYWKQNTNGWEWWQSPIETQSVLIEAFAELKDTVSVEQMKLWLIKNKQSNHWVSTKATTEAIYALLFSGKKWSTNGEGVRVKIGDEPFNLNAATSATGYVKTAWEPAAITPAMAQVEINKTTPGPVWGALYWQHFERLDEIKATATGVQLEKKLYLKKNTTSGLTLKAITAETPIRVGDLITVRLTLRADRDFSFIHLKDMRASGFEPIHVLSTYKWQDGLGYYESTKDAATNFFFDRLPKGTYVFEYDVRATHAGVFANGISTMQSMYAPEMSAHSEGITIQIQAQE